MSLPKELNLGSNKPMASSGKPAILRYRSDNTSYVSGDVVRIEIPCGRQGQYAFPMDSYLEGKVKVNTTVTISGGVNTYVDQSVYSLFRRLRVIHGSTVVEDWLDCGKWWTALYDIQVNESERRGDTINKLVYDNSGDNNSGVYNNHLLGYVFNTSQAVGSNVDSSSVDFCFTIPSAIVGSLAQKALPLSLMGASSLYIELELNPANVAFVQNIDGGTAAGSINSFTMSDIYYNAKVTNLPQEVESAIIESTGGVINLPAISYKSEIKSVASGSSAFNDKFSFQYSSIKNFLFFLQNQSVANGGNLYRSVSCRPRCNANEYYLNINGEVFPSQPISGLARQYTELLRSFDMLTDTNAGGIITLKNYNNNVHTTASSQLDNGIATTTTDQHRFIAGIDLDRFNRSSDVLMSGVSTIGMMMSLVLNFSSSLTDNVLLYGACMYDVLYHLENGQLTYKI
jgi:hypothetical protein